ncbi:hypothetical protein [Ancrocorticia populi]|uniref:hypothetical protein n=1 Tax=Ancrocorticia populi TaxID=2175228 RepID=UPI003F8F65D7
MSTINPNSRWWNRTSGKVTLAWILWIVAMACCFAVGWMFDLEDSSETPAIIISVLFPVALLLIIGNVFVYPNDEDNFNPRIIFFPLAGMFFFQGAGDLTRSFVKDQPYATYSLWTLGGGLAALVVIELVSRKLAGNRVVRGRVMRGGTRTRGRVTHARGYYENYHKVTRVTVQFTDLSGTQRWAKQTVAGTVRVGEFLPVQYLQGELDSSKSAVVIG